MANNPRFRGCKPGEKLYFEWANLATAESELGAANQVERREARAKTAAAFRA